MEDLSEGTPESADMDIPLAEWNLDLLLREFPDDGAVNFGIDAKESASPASFGSRRRMSRADPCAG
jgi:hypothetical protein